MHKLYIVLITTILFACADISFAGEFDCQPPILIETKERVNFSKIMLDAQIEEIMKLEGRSNYEKPQTNENIKQNMHGQSEIIGPLFYLSLGIQSEDRWFDRRLNWTNYELKANFEYEFIGLYVKGAGSDVGRDEFEIFNSQATLYFFVSDRTSSQEAMGWRIGGGITYFYSDPLTGQTFLADRRLGAFINGYFEGFEFKFVGLYEEDDIWGGGLLEIKYANPFFKKGFSATSAVGAFLNLRSALMLGLMLLLPTDYGITGAFGLPEGGDGWGWNCKWKYPFVFTYERLPYAKINPGFYWGIEFFWGYQGEFGNHERVSEGWEVGIRIFMFGF